METKGVLLKVLAILGTVLVWFPIAAMLVTGGMSSVAAGVLHMDWLLPAELFGVALAGGALLLGAALWARKRRGLVAAGLGAAVVLLFGSQGLAILTGLASAKHDPAGWPWILTLGAIAGYTLALVVVACAGVYLLRDLFRPRPAVAPVLPHA